MAGTLMMVFVLGVWIVLIVGMIAILVALGRHAGSTGNRHGLIAQAEQWTAQKVVDLLPWRSDALGDLAARPIYWQTRFVNFKARGTIGSHSGRGAWIAFCFGDNQTIWNSAQRERVVVARTTQDAWHIIVRDDVAYLSFNGAPLGQWRFTDGALLDPQGSTVGEAVRPQGWLTSFNGLPLNGLPNYGVFLHGSPIGTISTAGTAAPRGTLRPVGKGTPLLTPTQPTLDDQQTRWLLAIGITEAAYWRFSQPRIGVGVSS
jgi:hypothetical protein